MKYYIIPQIEKAVQFAGGKETASKLLLTTDRPDILVDDLPTVEEYQLPLFFPTYERISIELEVTVIPFHHTNDIKLRSPLEIAVDKLKKDFF